MTAARICVFLTARNLSPRIGPKINQWWLIIKTERGIHSSQFSSGAHFNAENYAQHKLLREAAQDVKVIHRGSLRALRERERERAPPPKMGKTFYNEGRARREMKNWSSQSAFSYSHLWSALMNNAKNTLSMDNKCRRCCCEQEQPPVFQWLHYKSRKFLRARRAHRRVGFKVAAKRN
jgi:hypothetical protein